MTLYTTIDRCRSCGSKDLPEALNLGDFYISDFLESVDAHTDRAPLVLLRCADCTLVQLRHTVDRERLYRRYHYRSGTQEAMVQALRSVVEDGCARVQLAPGDVVLDIGANDGTLLEFYPTLEWPEGGEPSRQYGDWDLPPALSRLAYEPAHNLWPEIRKRGGHIAGSFFPNVIGGSVVGLARPAKIITSIAMFYDVDNPGQFVEGVKANLAEDGIWINQMAYLPDTLRANNFGDICHEHLTYWTVSSFADLAERHGMHIQHVSFNDVNGGSVRFIVGRGTEKTQRVDTIGLLALRRFQQRIKMQRTQIRDFLHRAKREGKVVMGYGASTKGNSYLQYWEVGPDLLHLIADRNPDKWLTRTPTGQMVITEQQMRAARPDYLLVLPWHFIDSFVQREAELLAHGTQFVVPFPELRLIGEEQARSAAA